MGTETELKFEVAPQDLRKLKAAPALHRKPAKEENLISVYFDTPKHKLARNGVSLRVRHNGDKRLQTVKSEGSGDSFRRGEWEREIRGNVPNLRKTPGTALAPLLIKLKRRLKPIFATNVHRTRIPVFKNGSRIEVALDEGQVRAGRRSASISELELELKRGKAGDVFKLARELAKLVPAKLELKSKAERGYDLIEHKPIQAVRAAKIKLRRGMSTADAFRIIARSTLRHITANETAVQRSDSEGVHQMRVGLRRLRAAISLFSKLFGDKQTERIKSELNWLETGELSPARDLDVYEKGTVEPLRRAAPATRGMKELEDALASRRAAAFAKAKAVIDSPRYRYLLLDTLQWLEVGDWARRPRRFCDRPIERFAADILTQRTKNATKKTKRLRKFDTRQRHKLRIAVKKLRYASDFFGRLFGSHKARKRVSGFKACLTDLQDHLGTLNDIAVHQKLGPKLVAGKSNTKVRARAFAARIVSDREQGEMEPLLKAAGKDAQKFARIRPFWT